MEKMPKNYKKSDKYWIMLWMIGIGFGVYCAYASAIMLVQTYAYPGEVKWTEPEKTWTSMSGYVCTRPAYEIRCVEPTPVQAMKDSLDLG